MKDKKSNYPIDVVEKLFFQFDKNEILIIKAHLLVEYFLNKYIEANNESEQDSEKMNFTFLHKLNICKLFGLFYKQSDLETYITDLNKLRNQVAHKYSIDDKLYDKIVNYANNSNNEGYKTKDDFRYNVLMKKSVYMCGKINYKTENIIKNTKILREAEQNGYISMI